MRRGGFSLIELMVVAALLITTGAIIWQAFLSAHDASDLQDTLMTAQQEVVRGSEQMVSLLRGASLATCSPLPADSLTFRAVADVDSNGFAVGADGRPELAPGQTIARDFDDRNGDGLRESQLILFDATTVRVLANGLAPNEDRNGNGVLDPGEDVNGNGRLERGIWFAREGDQVRITIDTAGVTRRGHTMTSGIVRTVRPRNP